MFAAEFEDIHIVERLFSSSLVAIVGLTSPRKLRICHFKKGSEICNYSYSNSILSVKLNRMVCIRVQITQVRAKTRIVRWKCVIETPPFNLRFCYSYHETRIKVRRTIQMIKWRFLCCSKVPGWVRKYQKHIISFFFSAKLQK